MDPVPEYYSVLSVRLSQVLDEIGMNQHIVMKRRQSYLRKETMETISYNAIALNVSDNNFGSQSEGTTTPGLNSDRDMLICHLDVNVIQDRSEWQRGKNNLLMIEDETTAPGYCRLQVLRSDVQLPREELPTDDSAYDTSNRVILKNTFIHEITSETVISGPARLQKCRHGPANTDVTLGFKDTDVVYAFQCKSWPRVARPWFSRNRQNQWPTRASLRMAEESGCFLVPVGHRLSEDECVEWRISPSLAERALMFSMNMTQIKCYVVLKMIAKSFISQRVSDTISSFHCKTALFWCIENTTNDFWKDENLITCIMHCLYKLLRWIKLNYCPQFMIPKENIFAGKLNPHKRRTLNEIFQEILFSKGQFLLAIAIDDVGQRLAARCNMPHFDSPLHIHSDIAGWIAFNENSIVSGILNIILKDISSNDDYNMYMVIRRLWLFTQQGTTMEQQAARLLVPFLCTTLGTVMASVSMHQGNDIPRQVCDWFACGMGSDVASSRLKFASFLYCSGDLYNAELVLQGTERRYDMQSTLAVCGCHNSEIHGIKLQFCVKVLPNKSIYTEHAAFCVRFLRNEMFCVPPSLQYEMFRSIGDDVQYRDKYGDWMDWAVVDSLPYLYYLQYMTYRQMGRHVSKYQAMNNLSWSIAHEINLGHTETAWNLLGTCMELEHRVEEACICYRKSLEIRPRNNAANWHMVRLMSQIVQNNHPVQ